MKFSRSQQNCLFRRLFRGAAWVGAGRHRGIAPQPEEERLPAPPDVHARDGREIGDGLAPGRLVEDRLAVNREDEIPFPHARPVGGNAEVDGPDPDAAT